MYKLISCKSIVRNMINLFNMPSGLQYDCIIWIGDAIEHIGDFNFTNKVKRIIVENGTIEIPCDFHSDNFLIYDNHRLNKNNRNINPHFSHKLGALSPEVVELNELLKVEIKDDCDNELLGLNTESLNKKIDNIATWLSKRTQEYCSNYYYKEGENCYKTNIPDGNYVYLFYKGFAVDDEGFPLIKNEVKFREAIEFYCMWKLTLKGYKHPSLNIKEIYELQRKSMAQATNQQLKLTWEQLDDFTSNWTNMLFSLRNNNNYYSN